MQGNDLFVIELCCGWLIVEKRNILESVELIQHVRRSGADTVCDTLLNHGIIVYGKTVALYYNTSRASCRMWNNCCFLNLDFPFTRAVSRPLLISRVLWWAIDCYSLFSNLAARCFVMNERKIDCRLY